MALMKVEEALDKLLNGVSETGPETVPLSQALGRILAQDLIATRNQPPFSASAMDGYAVKSDNITEVPKKLLLVGEVPAGYSFPDTLNNWEAVRIFTGAPVPDGADAILIQENAERQDPYVIALEKVIAGQHIRKAGIDFKEGDVKLKKGHKIDAIDMALIAAMNHASVPVLKRPKVAVLGTGDELVLPGETPNESQIIASNNYAVSALVQSIGAEAIDLGIARDDRADIAAKVQKARALDADILVTSGGVSVGDHDYVQEVLTAEGMELDFWKIAMRPGKPLMAGKLGPTQVLGLPGNPASAIVCALLFLLPLVRKMQGDSSPQALETASLGTDLPANGIRQQYVRAMLSNDGPRGQTATPASNQDSSLLSTFSRANCLIIRPPHAPDAKVGDACEILRL